MGVLIAGEEKNNRLMLDTALETGLWDLVKQESTLE